MSHPQKIKLAALSGDHVSSVKTLTICLTLQAPKEIKPRIGLVTRRGRTLYEVKEGCPKRDDIEPTLKYIDRLNNASN